jgi:hypothetical protein
MKMRPESPNCGEHNGFATMLLRERRLTLKTLESEHQSIGMTPSDYENCRRSLLQAIDEIETSLPNQGRTHPNEPNRTIQAQTSERSVERHFR